MVKALEPFLSGSFTERTGGRQGAGADGWGCVIVIIHVQLENSMSV